MNLTIEVFILVDSVDKFIGAYDTLEEATHAANEDIGGYQQEIYAHSGERNQSTIPLYPNFSRHDAAPRYFVHRYQKSVMIVESERVEG